MKGHTNNPDGRKPADIAGRRFSRLIAERYAGGSRWECKCDCGISVIVKTSNLMNSHTTSCGCLRRETAGLHSLRHGHARTGKLSRTWTCWRDMIRRCSNPRRSDFYLYGGRGIRVSAPWRRFETFLLDMGEKPRGKTIGRKDNDGHYCKENCRWETADQQANNKRNNHRITVGTECLTVSQWARKLSVNPHLIFSRLAHGWREDKAVTTPRLR